MRYYSLILVFFSGQALACGSGGPQSANVTEADSGRSESVLVEINGHITVTLGLPDTRGQWLFSQTADTADYLRLIKGEPAPDKKHWIMVISAEKIKRKLSMKFDYSPLPGELPIRSIQIPLEIWPMPRCGPSKKDDLEWIKLERQKKAQEQQDKK